ncbi:MAG: hypothetical protein ACYSWX_02540 [Planctomycetota bacterium]
MLYQLSYLAVHAAERSNALLNAFGPEVPGAEAGEDCCDHGRGRQRPGG